MHKCRLVAEARRGQCPRCEDLPLDLGRAGGHCQCNACSGFACDDKHSTRLAVSLSAGPIARLELSVAHVLCPAAACLVVPLGTDADRR